MNGIMPVDVAQAVSRLITSSVSCTGTATQMAGVKALTTLQDDVDVMVDVAVRKIERKPAHY